MEAASSTAVSPGAIGEAAMESNAETAVPHRSEESPSGSPDEVAASGSERKLRAACLKTGSHLSAYMRKKFGLCFKSVETAQPEWYNAKVDLHLQNFQTKLQNRLDSLIAQRNLRKLLVRLEDINNKPSDEEIAWRPSGVPKEDVRALLFEANKKYARSLRAKLQQRATAARRKSSQVAALREDVEARAKQLQETEEWAASVHQQMLK